MLKHTKTTPKYYRNMYLDGYSPEEILSAAHKDAIQRYQERHSPSIEDMVQTMVEKKLPKVIDKSLNDIFKTLK